MFRRINYILLIRDKSFDIPQNDFESFKLINELRISMDLAAEQNIDDFKKSVLKLMHYLVEFNKYMSQRIDELAPWHLKFS